MKFKEILLRITKMRFIEMSLVFQLITVIAIYIMLIMDHLHLSTKGDPISSLARYVFVNTAPASFILGFLGIIFNKNKLLAIVTTSVAGIPAYFVMYEFFNLIRLH